jgi:hypothetical protein
MGEPQEMTLSQELKFGTKLIIMGAFLFHCSAYWRVTVALASDSYLIAILMMVTKN